MNYRWSSVEFSEEYPIVWCRPVSSKPGEPASIPLKFSNLDELKELTSTLKGAVNAIERERGARKLPAKQAPAGPKLPGRKRRGVPK